MSIEAQHAMDVALVQNHITAGKAKPWETLPEVWPTEAKYFTWVRGEIRRLWANNPLRNEFIKSMCRPVTMTERMEKKFHPSTKKVGQCALCCDWMASSKFEVDHKIATDGCTSVKTAEKFLWRMAWVDFDELQLACKFCHKIKSYAERYGLEFNEAIAVKAKIHWFKQDVDDKKSLLREAGASPSEVVSEPKRKLAYDKYMVEIGVKLFMTTKYEKKKKVAKPGTKKRKSFKR